MVSQVYLLSPTLCNRCQPTLSIVSDYTRTSTANLRVSYELSQLMKFGTLGNSLPLLPSSSRPRKISADYHQHRVFHGSNKFTASCFEHAVKILSKLGHSKVAYIYDLHIRTRERASEHHLRSVWLAITRGHANTIEKLSVVKTGPCYCTSYFKIEWQDTGRIVTETRWTTSQPSHMHTYWELSIS